MNLRFKKGYTLRLCDIQADDCVAYKVVAIASYANDWAAYKGPSDWTDEEIALNGDKIPQKAAELLFYAFANSGRDYRD